VQSAEANRSYIASNLKLLRTVYGEAAVKKTIIFITKGESILDKSKKNKYLRIKNRMQDYIEEARKDGAMNPIYLFNHYDDEDYAEDILANCGMNEGDIGYYMPYMRW